MTKTVTPATDAAEASATPFSIDLAEAARLGAAAQGIEIVQIDTPEGFFGLPAKVPLALHRGKEPAVNALANVIESYRLHPKRKQGTAEAQTFESFCELINRHKSEHSVIFADADWREPSFTAVIDYHHLGVDGQPDYGRHRVHYAFPLSEEWQAWNKMNGQKMTQEDFAYFLEDRVAELSAPTAEERTWLERDFATTVATPSQLVELSRGLQVNVASKVKAVHTLANGEGQIAWEESHQDANGAPLKVPGIFILSVPPFFMGDKMRIPVRLRYRAAGGSVTWFYQIYRPDQFITEHVRRALFDAREKTGLPAYEGKPETGA
ncbi:DUF2303 family protein [Shinella sp. NM-101]|uniref:DUF2303 family protein n=1 Tax=Shinella sp. NM-101 TaxID=2744455 RepID=UPI001F33ED0D|nr:DUF2303 family protein [Shinella sp. NM-101]